jgi:hypothetical protein
MVIGLFYHIPLQITSLLTTRQRKNLLCAMGISVTNVEYGIPVTLADF